ncbi:MAG TPA: hypothetical protein VKQ30_03260 [Ktedonobacterales bacterium]|nr:hypothetical protein [Ktedonobacterales bacterium]
MAGTSAGAKKGWETRRRKKAPAPRPAPKVVARKAEGQWKAKLGKHKTSPSGYVYQNFIVTRPDGHEMTVQVTMREASSKGRYGQRVIGRWLYTNAEAKAEAIKAAKAGRTMVR